MKKAIIESAPLEQADQARIDGPPSEPAIEGRAGGAPRVGLFDLARAGRRAYVQIFGIPDYEHYAAHMSALHPGAPMMSRREFFACSIDRKYSGRGPRCC